MNKEELQKYIGLNTLSLMEAMQKIDYNARNIIYIIDENRHLCGSLTDGDIRRWILKTGNLDCLVSEMLFKKTKYLFEADVEIHSSFMKKEKIQSVPIVDADLHIVDIYFQHETDKEQNSFKNDILKFTPVVIMAGGKGMRLHPYTKILPKPLIPIGDIPILERILNRFYEYGVKKYYLTVNYKKEMIKSYFSELKPPYTICYIEENIPLGTAGSIRLIEEKFENPVLITNCDTLIMTDYKKVLEYHKKSGNDMTIVSSLKNTIIPYGVLHSKQQGIVTSIEEKPQISYFINTGMYIVNPEFLYWIPENMIFHMTDLADQMIKNHRQVGMYPISENSFLDMGEFEELKRMEKIINTGEIE